MGRKCKPARPEESREKPNKKLAWYIMVGFKEDDIDQVGCLGLNKDPNQKKTYEIVDRCDAMQFPSQNVNHVKGFGTPEQWLEFFNNDPELEGWKFHLSRTLHR